MFVVCESARVRSGAESAPRVPTRPVSFARRLWRSLVPALCGLVALEGAPGANKLAGEKSPYLLQHKDQPVDWRPWGGEAFAEARRKNKPVFLSIGYSACHWCHVMARESFDNAQTAQFLNEHFVNIKVDREERPDIDRIAMAFVQATTGSGGWPLNVWLTPGGEPFFGGTYFPPEERHGLPAFPAVAARIAGEWKTKEKEIRAQGARVLAALQRSAAPAEVSDDLPTLAYESLIREYDAGHGGFGTAPKFPAFGPLHFLLRRHAAAPDSPEGRAALEMTLGTLGKIAAGGLRDHLGGGFHRYAADRAWRVPHFEKMLPDQALLAMAFLEAWQVTGDPYFAEIARETLDFSLGGLALPAGGFASALEAESSSGGRAVEGAYYVWTAEEINQALGAPDAAAFRLHYGVADQGNVPAEFDPTAQLRERNVLFESLSLSETARQLGLDEDAAAASLARSRAVLLARRSGRPAPRIDDKVVTAWNALLIAALARAGAALDEPRYIEAARRAAGFLLAELADPATGTLRRSWRGSVSNAPVFAEDYAFLIQALLDLYESTADPAWFDRAATLQETQDRLFWDDTSGGYFDSAADDPLVKVRLKNDRDGAEPAANSVSAHNLLRLARARHDADQEKKALRIVEALSASLRHSPSSLPMLLTARQAARTPPQQAVIAGDPDHPETQALARAVLREFSPDLVILYAQRPPRSLSPATLETLAAMTPVEGRPALYLCKNFACLAPLTGTDAVRKALSGR